MRFVIKWGIYINIVRCGVYNSDESVYDSLPPLRSAPCWSVYQFSDTKIRIIIYTTKQKGGLFNIISIYLYI